MKSLVLRLQNLLGRWYYSICSSFSKGRRKVLVFHEVRNDISEDVSCRIRTSSFKNIIERENENNEFVSIEALLRQNNQTNCVVVTFDDVPHSFLDNAYPILKEKNIPFTLFVCKKYVGKDGFLSESEIQELDKDPLCTIGAHTLNHVRLRNEPDSREDIAGSKKYLEDLLNHEIKYFAYPYGRYDSISRKNRKEVEEAGFAAGFSTIQSLVPNVSCRFFIPRIELIK